MDKINVISRLSSLGYNATTEDDWVLDFLIEKVTTKIKTNCNSSDIPTGLTNISIDMVCGEFLLEKKSRNKLTEIDLSTIIKSIQIGDTNTNFTDNTENRFDSLIKNLMHNNVNYGLYRGIKWTK